MAKFYGVIGFAESSETTPGIWTETIVEKNYYGDVVRNIRKLQNSQYASENIDIANEFNIVADPYAQQNFHAMRYISWMGSRWKITSVEVLYPRLILSVGGLYNGNTPST